MNDIELCNTPTGTDRDISTTIVWLVSCRSRVVTRERAVPVLRAVEGDARRHLWRTRINKDDGIPRWKYKHKSNMSWPTLHGDSVLVSTEDGKLLTFDL